MKIKSFNEFVNENLNELSSDTMARAHAARANQGMSDEELMKRYAVPMDNELYRINRGVPSVLAESGYYDMCEKLTAKLRTLVKTGDYIECVKDKSKIYGNILPNVQYGGAWVDGSGVFFGTLKPTIHNQVTDDTVRISGYAKSHPLYNIKVYLDPSKVEDVKNIVEEFEAMYQWVIAITPQIVKFAKGEGHQVLTPELAKSLPTIESFKAKAAGLSNCVLPLEQNQQRMAA
jgi:hypothetical protein